MIIIQNTLDIREHVDNQNEPKTSVFDWSSVVLTGNLNTGWRHVVYLLLWWDLNINCKQEQEKQGAAQYIRTDHDKLKQLY